jgi:hypothetical protein
MLTCYNTPVGMQLHCNMSKLCIIMRNWSQENDVELQISLRIFEYLKTSARISRKIFLKNLSSLTIPNLAKVRLYRHHNYEVLSKYITETISKTL